MSTVNSRQPKDRSEVKCLFYSSYKLNCGMNNRLLGQFISSSCFSKKAESVAVELMASRTQYEGRIGWRGDWIGFFLA